MEGIPHLKSKEIISFDVTVLSANCSIRIVKHYIVYGASKIWFNSSRGSICKPYTWSEFQVKRQFKLAIKLNSLESKWTSWATQSKFMYIQRLFELTIRTSGKWRGKYTNRKESAEDVEKLFFFSIAFFSLFAANYYD